MTLSEDNKTKIHLLFRGSWESFYDSKVAALELPLTNSQVNPFIFQSRMEFVGRLKAAGIDCSELDRETMATTSDQRYVADGLTFVYLFPSDTSAKDTYAIVPNELAMKILVLGDLP